MKKILNLVYSEASDIDYQVSHFPDGQQQVTIKGLKSKTFDLGKDGYYYVLVPLKELDITETIQIRARLNNFKDLELIICAKKSLLELGFRDIELYVPYFLGSRSDRKFEEGSNNYLKTVICPIINLMEFSKVITLDPHSDVLEACLNNFKKEDNYKLFEFFTKQKGLEDHVWVSPDNGASKKIQNLSEKCKYLGDIITCSKYRDGEGKLSKTRVPIMPHRFDNNTNFVLIDDICDGGATFINIAKEFKDKYDNSDKNYKLYLVVTHGIFSKGFEELNKYFDGIYCTNSYSDIPENYSNGMQKFKTNVKQLNVFK